MPSKTTADLGRRLRTILERAENCPGYRDFNLHWEGYAEPGYSDPESGVIATGDWNPRSFDRPIPKANNTMPRVAKLLEKLGVELEWEDEWAECSDCNKLVRTSPDSYSWTRSYWDSPDGYARCCDCVKADPADYLEHLEGNDRSCETIGVDLGENGYRLLEGNFENGLHDGQDADPKKIGKALRAIGVHRYLFSLDSVGQFDMDFSVWVHEDEWPKVEQHKADYEDANKRCDLSPAEACKRALADASSKMGALQGDGIRVAKCNPDGTADVKLVSAQDFIDGKALD